MSVLLLFHTPSLYTEMNGSNSYHLEQWCLHILCKRAHTSNSVSSLSSNGLLLSLLIN